MIVNVVECVVSVYGYDVLVGLYYCDKNGFGFVMVLVCLDYFGLIVSGGSIMLGCYDGKDIIILDVYDL